AAATQPRVNAIVVDPKDSQTAFALFDGQGFPHIYKTTDGGVSWTPVNALVGGGTLPDVPAYTMVIDPRAVVGAPSGRYYLGNGVGVYRSLDKGATWARLGQGLPAVPVVDLELNTSQELLAAATQGRGVFTLSTNNN